MQDTKKHILDILVENMGRSNILPVMNTQRKGKGTLLNIQKNSFPKLQEIGSQKS